MEAKKWVTKIRSMCRKQGIDPANYGPVIDTLAGILEKRDYTLAEFERMGGQPVITYTNKGGKSNPVKNPFLVLWGEMNTSALAYWRELGLTPSSYRKMTGDQPKKEKPSALEKALMNIEV